MASRFTNLDQHRQDQRDEKHCRATTASGDPCSRRSPPGKHCPQHRHLDATFRFEAEPPSPTPPGAPR